MSHTGKQLLNYLTNVATRATSEMYQYFYDKGLFTETLEHNDEGVCLRFPSPHEDYSVYAYSDNDWYTTHMAINEHYSGSIIFEVTAVKEFLDTPQFIGAIAKIPAYDDSLLVS